MGVESQFYIMPESSSFRPSPQQVVDLIVALRSEAFLCNPNAAGFAPDVHDAKEGGEGFTLKTSRKPGRSQGKMANLPAFLTVHRDWDVCLRWSNSNLAQSGLKYPLTILPGPDDVYYDIEIHLVAETLYHTSEVIEPFEDIRCACGAVIAELEPDDSDLFYSPRLPAICMRCHKPTEYEKLAMTFRDAWTGLETKGFGGVTYRFAVMVDCGKYGPDRTAKVSPDFLEIIHHQLGTKTREIRDIG